MHGGSRQTMVSVVCRVMGSKSSRRLTGPISKVSFHPETEVFSADNAGAD